MKPFSILFIFSLITASSFGQNSSTATASATIVNSVGAESNGNINYSNIRNGNIKDITTSGINSISSGINLSSIEEVAITSISIIGGSFVFDVIVQNNPITIGTGKNDCKMKLNLFKMTPISNTGNDKIIFPIGASLSEVESPIDGINSSFPFTVTINFN